MKYSITYSCGHPGEVNLVGKTSDRESKINWYETSAVCPQCYKILLEEQKEKAAQEHAEASEAARENAKLFSWPELSGSAKQIAWALTLRQEFYDFIISKSPNEIGMELLAQMINENTAASTWIDHKDRWLNFFRSAIKAKNTVSSDKLAAEAEATVEPSERKYSGKVVISVVDHTIFARYQLEEDFRQIVKNLGYEWNSNETAWTRKINDFNGSENDRVAELGNKLLLAGFSVQIMDASLREAAVAGNYKDECKRWVLLRVSGDYAGWLSINFPKGDEALYTDARSISGARWNSPSVVVPVSEYLAVLDFADMKSFQISESAMAAIENYKNKITIKTPIAHEATPIVEKNPADILKSSREVISDLRDD